MKNPQDPSNPIFDLDREVERCARYLLEKQESERLTGEALYDYSGLLSKLDSTERELSDAVKHLQNLCESFEFGRIEDFSLCEPRVRRSYESALTALVELRIAKIEVKIQHGGRSGHGEKTQLKVLQKSAARLAYAIAGNRVRGEARKLAIRIMDKANLGNPETSSLTRWLSEFRRDDGNVK